LATIEFRRDRKLWALGSALLIVAGMVGCRRNPAAPSAPQQSAKPMVQEPAQAQTESAPEKSCREFVQGFYDWYINGHLNDGEGPAWFDVAKKKPSLVGPQLLRLLEWDSTYEAATNSVGALDFDPFLAAQDWNEAYKVKRVQVRENHCDALVTGSPDLRKVELERRSADWAFTNFDYSHLSEDGKTQEYPDDDLIDILETARRQVRVEKQKRSHH